MSTATLEQGAAPTPLTLSPTPTISPSNPSASTTASTSTREKLSSPYEGQGTTASPFIVHFLSGAKENPYNWSRNYKWFITFLASISTLCVAFASSCYSAAVPQLQMKFGGSAERGVAGISLYVLGFGVGPLVWAPMSEIYGRLPAFYISYPLFAIFNLMGAVSNNWASILFSRLLAGTFGASPLTNSGAQVGDIWAPHERALPTMFFALAPFLGPVLGPIVGGFVSQSVGFRWVFWVQCFFAVVIFIVGGIFIPETYAPAILRRQAKALTAQSAKEGLNQIYVSKFDLDARPKKVIIVEALKRPFQLLFGELIVFCLSLYVAIIYATLYAFFTAFPIVFEESRHWTQGQGGLAFLGIGIGLCLALAMSPISKRRYTRQLAALPPNTRPPPEWRLTGAIIGSILLPIGLFWFAWTSTPNVHWVVPIIASIPFGCGFLFIFTSINLYLIDSYALWAASALAANAVMRSILATVFPLFTRQMYHNLGIQWAGTLVAFLSLICTPMPFLFYKYGHILRSKSRYAPTEEPEKSKPSDVTDGNEVERVFSRVISRVPEPSIDDEAIYGAAPTPAEGVVPKRGEEAV